MGRSLPAGGQDACVLAAVAVGQAVAVAAENVPGVKGVRDHLVWIDAASGIVIYSPDDEATRAKAS